MTSICSSLCPLCLCGYFFFVPSVASAAPQEVVPVEGETFVGELVSVGAEELLTFRVVVGESTVAEATAPSATAGKLATRQMKWDALVRWGHPVAPRARSIVVTADGGQIVTAAEWSGGAAVRLEGDSVVLLSDTFGEASLPPGSVRGVVFAHRRHPNEREQLVERVRATSGNQDTVLLTNDDRLTGNLSVLERGSLTIETKAGAAKLPLSRVEAIVFASRQPSARRPHSKLTVGLSDGSLVFATAARANDMELELELANALKLNGGSVAGITALQVLGGRFVYLSDLEPADYRHVPYLSIEWPYNRDRNVLGEPLVVGGKRYLKGLGMHSASRLTYRLDNKYKRFDAAVAVDDSAGKRGSVTFGAYVLRGGEWQETFKTGIIRGGDAPRTVSVDVSAAQGLTLTVDYADRGDELDHADWLDARLVKK
jgi:hypothetical protein